MAWKIRRWRSVDAGRAQAARWKNQAVAQSLPSVNQRSQIRRPGSEHGVGSCYSPLQNEQLMAGRIAWLRFIWHKRKRLCSKQCGHVENCSRLQVSTKIRRRRCPAPAGSLAAIGLAEDKSSPPISFPLTPTLSLGERENHLLPLPESGQS